MHRRVEMYQKKILKIISKMLHKKEMKTYQETEEKKRKHNMYEIKAMLEQYLELQI